MTKDIFFGGQSGVARGGGWQHIGAYINLGAFYVVGVPVAMVLGFVLHLKAKGLWIGIVAGSVVHSSLLFIIASFTNWKEQVKRPKFLLCPLNLFVNGPNSYFIH